MKPRPWLIRISVAIAVLCCLATAALNLIKVRQRVQSLKADLHAQTVSRQKAETDLAAAKAELTSTTLRLKQTSASLETALAEQKKAQAQSIVDFRRAEQLRVELAQLRQKDEDTSAKLAQFEAAGLDPEQVLYASKQLKSFQTQLATANAQLQQLEAKIIRLLKERQDVLEPVVLPSGLKAKVVATDPKWQFVVLDAGEKAGVRERGEVLLSRQGKLLGRARVSRVDPEQCVANLLPGWRLGEVVEGDSAIAAPPHS